MHASSTFITETMASKIINFFPEDRQKFSFVKVYDAKRDGWRSQDFAQKVYNQGPTLIILGTYEGVVSGGFTSKNWDGNNQFVRDENAFIFNMTDKYTPIDFDKAIFTKKGGFCFGNLVLYLDGEFLNGKNEGRCHVGKERFYNVEGIQNGDSPLTRQKEQFTCSYLEVYRIFFD